MNSGKPEPAGAGPNAIILNNVIDRVMCVYERARDQRQLAQNIAYQLAGTTPDFDPALIVAPDPARPRLWSIDSILNAISDEQQAMFNALMETANFVNTEAGHEAFAKLRKDSDVEVAGPKRPRGEFDGLTRDASGEAPAAVPSHDLRRAVAEELARIAPALREAIAEDVRTAVQKRKRPAARKRAPAKRSTAKKRRR